MYSNSSSYDPSSDSVSSDYVDIGLAQSDILSVGLSKFPKEIENRGVIPEGKELHFKDRKFFKSRVKNIKIDCDSVRWWGNVKSPTTKIPFTDSHDAIASFINNMHNNVGKYRSGHYAVYWKTLPYLKKTNDVNYSVHAEFAIVHKNVEVEIK